MNQSIDRGYRGSVLTETTLFTHGPVAVVATLCAIMWMNYTIHGFRLPWSPIVVSDADSGAGLRQLIFASAGLFALLTLINRRILMQTLVRYLPWTLLAMGVLFSSLWSYDPGMSGKRGIIMGLGMLLIMASVSCNQRPAHIMQLATVGTVTASALTSLIAWALLPAGCSSIIERPGLAGISNHPNTLGSVMFTGLMISLGMTAVRRWEVVILRFSQCLMLTCLVLTGSITSWFVFLIGLAVYLALTQNSYRRGVMAIGITVTVTLIWLIGVSQVQSWVFDVLKRDESLSGRDSLWSSVWHEGWKQPVFGYGFGGFWYEGRGRELTGTWNPRQAHNAWIDLFVDLGLLGVITVGSLFINTLLVGWIHWSSKTWAQRRLVASIIGLGVAMLAIYATSQSFILKLDQFTMFILLWGLLIIGRTNSESNLT